MQNQLKRGTKIQTVAGMGVVQTGVITRLYTQREIDAHRKSHGEAAADDLANWFPVRLTDHQGTFECALHRDSLTVI